MTERQEILLCAQCIEWMKLLRRIINRIHQIRVHANEAMKQLNNGEEPHPIFANASQVADHLLQNVALIPVLLTHIYKSCEFFTRQKGDELDQRIEHFSMLYNSEEIRNVRNVIEHLEEYLVGKGNKPELVIDIERHMGLSFGGPKGELFIGIFGRRYNIGNVIQSVFLLHDALHNHRERLCGR